MEQPLTDTEDKLKESDLSDSDSSDDNLYPSSYWGRPTPEIPRKQIIMNTVNGYNLQKIDEDSVVQISKCDMCQKNPSPFTHYMKLKCGHIFCRWCLNDYLDKIPDNQKNINCLQCELPMKDYECYEWIGKKHRHRIIDDMTKNKKASQRNKKTRIRMGKELGELDGDYLTGIGTYENMTYDFGDDELTLKHDKNTKYPEKSYIKEWKRRWKRDKQRSEFWQDFNEIKLERCMEELLNKNKEK